MTKTKRAERGESKVELSHQLSSIYALTLLKTNMHRQQSEQSNWRVGSLQL